MLGLTPHSTVSNCMGIIRLISMMGDYGMLLEIPEVSWDADGVVGKMRIGRVEGMYYPWIVHYINSIYTLMGF